MRLVSFDALRVLGFPNTTTLKPEAMLRQRDLLDAADWVLFPEYWQINAIHFGLHKPIFPSLPTYLIGHDKVQMTRAFEVVAPANTPETLILSNTPEHAELAWERMVLPFVAKLPRSSMGEGVWLIEGRDQWLAYLRKTEVIYAQEHLPIDRDLRIVWVGNRVLSAYWRLQSPDGFHNNIARGGVVCEGVIPQAALELVERVALALGVDHAGFDVAMVGTHPYLLEFNRLFGNKGIDNEQLKAAILDYLHRHHQPDDPEHPVPVMPMAG